MTLGDLGKVVEGARHCEGFSNHTHLVRSGGGRGRGGRGEVRWRSGEGRERGERGGEVEEWRRRERGVRREVR